MSLHTQLFAVHHIHTAIPLFPSHVTDANALKTENDDNDHVFFQHLPAKQWTDKKKTSGRRRSGFELFEKKNMENVQEMEITDR